MESIGGVGMVLTALPKTQTDGMVIIAHTEALADRLVACAKENEQFYKTLSAIMTGSVWTALAVECGTIVATLLAIHGVNPLAKRDKQTQDNDANVTL